jgi:hypothetical protein
MEVSNPIIVIAREAPYNLLLIESLAKFLLLVGADMK